MSKAHRLPFQRIAVTVPPADWFHGIARALFDIYRGTLESLGLEIFDVPVDAFLLPDVARIDRIVSDLKVFRPELAMGLHRGAYALLCRLPARRDGWRPNVFTEILDIPTVCLWDHAPLELADQLLAPHASGPDASVAGAREKLARCLTHPRMMHWSPDTGQTQLMKELGFLLPDHVIDESMPTLPGFLPHEIPGKPSVAFVGHLYQQPPDYPDPALRALAESALEAWLHASGRSLWYVLSERMDALDSSSRKRLALDLDQSYFWHFAHRLVLHDAQTARRLNILGSAGVPITCYGNLNPELPGVPRNLIPVPGHIPYGPELAVALARHAITIDVFNPGYIHGYSHKPMITFASGGFMLVDRKRDFIGAFGDAGEAVSYGPDSDDLAAKIDRFLTNPTYLREVGAAIRETISERFQLTDVLARVLEAAFRCAGRPGTGSTRIQTPEQTTAIENLLPAIQSDPARTGAGVWHVDGAIVVTATQQWSYAATIRIPEPVRTLREPHLRMRIMVKAGRIGIAALLDSGALIAEQHLSATQHPVHVTIELPPEGVSNVILRSTAETASRALVLEATLCDRAARPS